MTYETYGAYEAYEAGKTGLADGERGMRDTIPRK